MRKRQVPAPNPYTVVRGIVRRATLGDLDLLVRHRRGMWRAIARISKADLDAADRAYRRWARTQMKSNRFAGFIVDVGEEPVASGCVWLMQVQPRPNWKGTTAAYLLSMFTEPAHRGRGHGARIVRETIRFARARGIHVMLLHASAFGEPIYTRLGFERTTEMRLFLDLEKRRSGRVGTSEKTARRAR
ncbi:MAG TPA: GNAT family N-acetyltransferase [Thermoplasmata archaeon]|nr:GNAT family N-acetyltransferase [Thermoplasmata archaeon]